MKILIPFLFAYLLIFLFDEVLAQTNIETNLLFLSNQAFKDKNWQTAFDGYKTLAEAGITEAQFKLGYFYRNGKVTIKDFAEAASWYKKAAEKGHIKAQNYLAISLELGRGVEKNLQLASYWYRRAAEQNNLNAMHWMAKAHLSGIGLQQDFLQSYIWFTLARDLEMDCGRMRSGQAEAKKHLSSRQLQTADLRINTWRNNGRKGAP